MRRISCFLFLLLSFNLFFAQEDSLRPVKNKRLFLSSGTAILSVGSLIALNQLWYSQYNTGRFHFFNDNGEWLQMDKVGHVFTTYQTSRLMMDAFQWAGYNERKKLIMGGGIGLMYMTAIEVMDGFSRGWGYSWGDQLADVVGSAMAISQEALWKDQRIQLKFSYAPTSLAKYNPDLLGENKYSRILKDYNGQTYWLSVNPSAFIKSVQGVRWLSGALGYSAYGMVGGHYNRILVQDPDGTVYKIERVRKYYLSLDVDLTRINTKSKFLKGLFSVINILKFPAPALEFSEGRVKFFPLYY